MHQIHAPRNQCADIFRVVLILMVIAIHVNVFPDNPLINFLTVDGVFRIAVPVFFIINGYYFHKNVTGADSFRQWLRRALILFVCWQVIYLPLYLPFDDLSARHIAVFISQVLFGYHHLWYVAAMATGGIGLYLLKDRKYALVLCLLLYLTGWGLQYARIYLNIDSTAYKIFSQYWIFRNGLFYGLPMMYLGYYIAKKNLVKKTNPNMIYGLVALSFICLLIEIILTDNAIFSGVTYHIDFIIMIVFFCPLLFIAVMQDETVYVKGFDTKILATVCAALYFIHPYVIYFVSKTGDFPAYITYLLTVSISLLLSLVLFLFRKKLKYLF